MNESIESGGCVLYQARKITVAIGADPNLWLFFGESQWRFDNNLYPPTFPPFNKCLSPILGKTFHKYYGAYLLISDVLEYIRTANKTFKLI